MAKYRLKKEPKGYSFGFNAFTEYDGNFVAVKYGPSVEELVIRFPDEWDLVPDRPATPDKLDQLIEKWEKRNTEFRQDLGQDMPVYADFITDLKSLKA